MAGAGNAPSSEYISSSSQRSLLSSNGKHLDGFGRNAAAESDIVEDQKPPQAGISRLAFLQRYASLASQAQLSPSKTFRKLAEAREMVSIQTPSGAESENSSHGIRFREGVKLPGVGEIRWITMKKYAKEWLRNPKNLALLAWILAVAVSGAILFMVMVGMLNGAIPKKSSRNAWFEVNNQILNALFTLMCLYLHPQRFLHAFQLYRWSRPDVISLRKVYCKDGLRKPHEWAHMVVVVTLLHLNCFSQYALCGLNWGYKRSARPPIGVALCLTGAIGFSAAAGIYNMLSPLGKDYVEEEADQLRKLEEGDEGQEQEQKLRVSSGSGGRRRFYSLLERRRSFASRDGKMVERPEWQGGVLDCCMDQEVALLTTICSFCVFGWNMDRLGFGNRFVHIATFLLICTAPYWIFFLAAGNIDNKSVRQGLQYAGIVLSVFGLLYGGFWRIRMRKTYGLPPQKWCFGQPNATDCTLWLFCSLCSLCQEVRTAGHYDVHDEKFYVKGPAAAEEISSPSSSPVPSPLHREEAIKAPFENIMNVEMVAPVPVTVNKDEEITASAPAQQQHLSPAREQR